MLKPKLAADVERLRLIRLIHVAKRELHLEEDVYRQVLLTASGDRASSSSDLTVPELEQALARFKQDGFKVRIKGKPAPARPPSSRRLAADPEAKKIRALWLLLHALGAIKNPSEAALAAYVKRLTHVDDLHWISSAQAEKLIESMKKWALRFLPAAVNDLALQARDLPLPDQDKYRLSNLFRTAFTRGTFDPMQAAWQAFSDVLRPPSGASAP